MNEQRTGRRPYSGAYSYFADNNRKTALVITNGVTVHDGAYSYDNGGRLSQVIDSATNIPIEYTWHADNTPATMSAPTTAAGLVTTKRRSCSISCTAARWPTSTPKVQMETGAGQIPHKQRVEMVPLWPSDSNNTDAFGHNMTITNFLHTKTR